LYFTESSFCLRVLIPIGSLPSGWSSLPYLTGSLGLPTFPLCANSELDEDGKIGRPKDPVRYGKDDHPEGRDPLGIKTLKQKEGSVAYKPRKSSYFEVFKDMNGNKKTILTEDLTKE